MNEQMVHGFRHRVWKNSAIIENWDSWLLIQGFSHYFAVVMNFLIFIFKWDPLASKYKQVKYNQSGEIEFFMCCISNWELVFDWRIAVISQVADISLGQYLINVSADC